MCIFCKTFGKSVPFKIYVNFVFPCGNTFCIYFVSNIEIVQIMDNEKDNMNNNIFSISEINKKQSLVRTNYIGTVNIIQ